MNLKRPPIEIVSNTSGPAKATEALEPNGGNPFAIARERLRLSQPELARRLNTSLYALVRWERGDQAPSAEVMSRLNGLFNVSQDWSNGLCPPGDRSIEFASSGIKTVRSDQASLFDGDHINVLDEPRTSVLEEIFTNGPFWSDGHLALGEVLERNAKPARTRHEPLDEEISAGKNTYTYDAHTYHTKVPPQGIANVISKYLPEGGVVLDPFAGSGMTGVAARYLGHDVILNELSPAAAFISFNFLASIDTEQFRLAVSQVLTNLHNLQRTLYLTRCRECGSEVVQLYTVWSYILECDHCEHDFVLWEHCRKYGDSVREHRILRRFPCPHCGNEVNKSHLKRKRVVPVFVGYRCCSKRINEHPLDGEDYSRIETADGMLEGYLADIPRNELPDGVNLNQPKRHGLDAVDKLYTPRNLTACASIWREIRRIEDPDLASALAFVFTSMYQRVTRLSEYRFWGGSGNMANYNVPQISNESNVYETFKRKAETIRKHLVTTAQTYRGTAVIRTGSATDLDFLPDNSVDFIFTDPPFGANINYSEMNFLWESWLGRFTNPTTEAVINRYQGKDLEEYQALMTGSLKEAYRVLRMGHWMVLVFMNSSEKVWGALNDAIEDAGFSIQKVNIFDKQHGTFKQFVSDNTAGADLMIHCKKMQSPGPQRVEKTTASVSAFVLQEAGRLPVFPFIHVERDAEVDYRTLYSRYISAAIQEGMTIVSFPDFRDEASVVLERSL